jgi:superfamily II DNA or RNA helicase
VEKKIPILLDNRIRILTRDLPRDAVTHLENAFTYDNPQFKKRLALSKSMHIGMGDVQPRISKFAYEGIGDSQVMTFPRGGLHKVRSILALNETNYRIVDERFEGPEVEFPPLRGDPPWEHQNQAVDASIAKQNCLIRSPTGSGKTTAAIASVVKLKRWTLIIVPTKGIFKVWFQRIEALLGLGVNEIGVLKAGMKKPKPITIAMQGTIASLLKQGKLAQYTKMFGVVIADEVQKFAAKTFFDAIDPFAAKWRIGYSADETRQDQMEFLIYDLFGAVALDIQRRELIEKGIIHDVQICVIPTEFKEPGYAMRPNFNKLLDRMTVDETRNRLAYRAIEREVKQGNQVMVLSHRVEHAKLMDHEMVKLGIQSGIMTGENEAQYNASLEGLTEGRLRVASGTLKAIGTGIDVPALDVGCITTPLANNKQEFNQVRGRICRTSVGKTRARCYYLWDRHIYGIRAIENLTKWNDLVVVYDEGKWIDGKEYLDRIKGGGKRGARFFNTDGKR